MHLTAIQSFLRQQRIDAWLLHDFRGSNPILARLAPPDSGHRWTTRRVELLIPAAGPPELLLHRIDSIADFGSLERQYYTSWQQLHAWLAQRCRGRRIAMDYSPGGSLPAMSYVDAGTIELIRGLGAEVVSSADLIQAAVATWSSQARENHARASREVTRIKDAAFEMIRRGTALHSSDLHEHQVQQFILAEFAKAGLETPEPPIVAVNAHSGDPHYAPSESRSAPVRKGDWVLIDLWARTPGDDNIYSDITWVGYCGREVPAKHREVFETVKRARDAALAAARSAGVGGGVQGWQLDDAAMHQLRAAGFEEFIRHRTGHSLSPGPLVHGLGMNLDNLETHDTRAMLPGIGFTIEPGLYLPDFGVRLEINIFVDPQGGPEVTSCIQDDILLLAEI